MHPLISGDLARVMLHGQERELRERAERERVRADRPGAGARVARRITRQRTAR